MQTFQKITVLQYTVEIAILPFSCTLNISHMLKNNNNTFNNDNNNNITAQNFSN